MQATRESVHEAATTRACVEKAHPEQERLWPVYIQTVYTHRIIILNLGHHHVRGTSINRSWNQGEWQDFSPWGTGEEIFNLKKQRCEWGFGTVCSYFKSCLVEVRLNQSAEIKAKISDGYETVDHVALHKGTESLIKTCLLQICPQGLQCCLRSPPFTRSGQG